MLRADPDAMLPPDEQLCEELAIPTCSTDTGKIKVMDKPTMRELLKRSPDRADALCLIFSPAGFAAGLDLTQGNFIMGRFKKIRLSRERGGRGLYDPLTGRKYSHCAVSLVGPSAEKPGFVVCCGEELTIRPPREIFRLNELESLDFDVLLCRAAEFRNEYDADEATYF